MPEASVDRLSALLERFRVRAQLFHSGALCGVTDFDARPGRGFLHVMRRGRLTLTHSARLRGVRSRIEIVEPSLLFYATPVAHRFEHAPADASDFTCASVDFEGGEHNPLARALPPLILLPLARVPGLDAALELLFAETEQLRCGSRLLADRLFEVVLIQLLRWLIDHADEAGVPRGLLTGLADARLARALVALHESPGQAWPLARLAERAGMSRSAFAAAFKAAVGQTPGDYLAGWRLSLAAAQLHEGRSIKVIADELGYGSASALSRLFKHKLGRSPRFWLAEGATAAAG